MRKLSCNEKVFVQLALRPIVALRRARSDSFSQEFSKQADKDGYLNSPIQTRFGKIILVSSVVILSLLLILSIARSEHMDSWETDFFNGQFLCNLNLVVWSNDIYNVVLCLLAFHVQLTKVSAVEKYLA